MIKTPWMSGWNRAAWLCACMSLTGFFGRASGAPLPNIVVILADDLGYGDLSCYGAKKISTPNIDRLAKDGMRFTDAHAPASVCSPSRYALMTGRYDWRTSEQCGVLMEDAPLHIEPGRLTLASMLRKCGYRTGCIGKWHLGIGMNPKTDWNAPLAPGPLEVGFDCFFGLPANHENQPLIYIENHEVVDRVPGEKIEITGRSADDMTKGVTKPRVNEECGLVLADKAAAFIEGASADKPFFLYYAPIEPHNPITPNERFQGTSQCGPYGDFVQQLDHDVGVVIGALERKGVFDNTLIILTSDNGGLVYGPDGQTPQSLALRMGHKINGELREGKHRVYEGGSRVPLIACWPGHIPAGTESAQVISLVDLIATFADAVNYRFDDRELVEDSFSVLPVLLGQHNDTPIRAPVISVSTLGIFSIRDGDFKAVEERDRLPAITKHMPKPIEWWGSDNRKQVYNLKNDLSERQNLMAERPDVYERLTAILTELRRDGSSKAFDATVAP
ncbi:MAG: arylsulfatase [Verrucomicrobiaceae bacterium]|nr:MAG: arylsulfatase [Verrucomicrobiaceae bacterium]